MAVLRLLGPTGRELVTEVVELSTVKDGVIIESCPFDLDTAVVLAATPL
ncbi:hypothetical protein [Nonomuraea sp. NPDC049400]